MSQAKKFSFDFTSHNNHFLFSDHYLREILQRSRNWDQATDDALAFSTWIRDLYAREKEQLPNYNESQLEDHWFKPILTRLGHIYEGQATIPGLKATIKKPDFVLFPSETARQKAVAAQNTTAYAREALAVAEVKAWDVNLSKKAHGGGPGFADNNPMYQIDYYLRASDLPWGIVSNGRLWRLVHKDTSYKLDIYFEIDLAGALDKPVDDRGAQATIVYFLLFFGQAAFLPDAHGRIFLDGVLSESRIYARELEDDLADNAYKALEQLIAGFFAPSSNELDPTDGDDLRRVYDNSLYLLYRMLFLLYGESRQLLPMSNEQYRQRSMHELAGRVAALFDEGKQNQLPPMSREYWDRLSRLFGLINGSDPDFNAFLGLPVYNGGLFDPTQHPFLEEHFVGDRHLAAAIDYLARRITEQNIKERVDYRTLGIRQLGSIYEGLLEYGPQIAEEPLVAVRKKGKDRWITAAERGRSKALESREAGELYLATDEGERKATGSIYTPHYIVAYIVENTLRPILDAAHEEAAQERDDVACAKRFTDIILALNLLDPAMGSAHFLVEVTDVLAAALATNEWIAATTEGESDIVYWRRRVVEACVYGVDKNALAVELAKLSLWLVTAASDRPLSFLDHHLRHGDSLVGARLDDLHALPGQKKKKESSDEQTMLFSTSSLEQTMFRAVGGFMQIEELLSDDLETVHLKEQLYEELRQTHLARWRTLADLWTSSFFGNEMSPEEYADLARLIMDGSAMMSEEQASPYLNHPAMQNNDYFHWELEFPEVFYDLQGNPRGKAGGFDAIVGNPPYVRIQRLNKSDPMLVTYLGVAYDSTSGSYDLYIPFVERGYQQLNVDGRFSFILPNKLFKLDFGEKLRGFLQTKRAQSQIIDFGDNQIFSDVTTYTSILALSGSPQPWFYYYRAPDLESDETRIREWLYALSRQPLVPLDHSQFGEDPWVLV